jgi:hypothetical protein
MPLPVTLPLIISAMWNRLCQCHLDLRLLAEHGGEAKLRDALHLER